jgi:hypothetical protein
VKPNGIGTTEFDRFGAVGVTLIVNPDGVQRQPGPRVKPPVGFNVSVHEGDGARAVVITGRQIPEAVLGQVHEEEGRMKAIGVFIQERELVRRSRVYDLGDALANRPVITIAVILVGVSGRNYSLGSGLTRERGVSNCGSVAGFVGNPCGNGGLAAEERMSFSL